MKIGCQIGVWGGSVEDAIRGMGYAGIAGIEVFTGHLVPYFGMERDAKDFLAQNNVEPAGAYFNNDKFISPADQDAVVSEAVSAAKFLGKIGTPFLILNGGVSKNQKPDGFSEDDFKQLAKTMNAIGKAVIGHGVRTVMHPHVGCMIETPNDVDRLLKYLDTSLVGLCIHAAHQVIADADPYEIYEKYAKLVKYAHIGEISADKKGAMFGEGMLDQKRLMKALLDAGFDGWIIVESSKDGVSPKDYLLHAKKYIEGELLK